MPAATARLSDSAVPVIGIATRRSAAVSRSVGRPVPSLPSSSASGSVQCASQQEVAACPDVAATVTPAAAAHARNSAPDSASATGTENSAPMLALTATGSYGSADGPMRITPEAPAALAVRMIVPTLPGLPGSCSAANRPRWHGQVLYGGGRAAHDRGQPGGTISVGDPSEQLPGQSRHPDSDRLLRVHHVQGAAVTQ